MPSLRAGTLPKGCSEYFVAVQARDEEWLFQKWLEAGKEQCGIDDCRGQWVSYI